MKQGSKRMNYGLRKWSDEPTTEDVGPASMQEVIKVAHEWYSRWHAYL